MIRPNILVIFTDQQSATMMSCAENRYFQTPAMDSLAERGTRFERAYCSFPVCIASRFSFKFSKRFCLAFSNAAIWALVRGFFLRVFWMASPLVSSATSGAASSGMILFWLVSSILLTASIIICGTKRGRRKRLLKDLGE